MVGWRAFQISSLCFRLSFTLVFFALAFMTNVGYETISESKAQLLTPPLSKNVRLGYQLGIAAGAIGTYLALVTFIFVVSCLEYAGYAVLFLAVCDWVLVSLLCVTIGFQDAAIGVPSPSKCRQIHSARPNNTNDTLVIFFDRVGALNATNPSFGSSNCQLYLVIWVIELVALLLFLMYALFYTFSFIHGDFVTHTFGQLRQDPVLCLKKLVNIPYFIAIQAPFTLSSVLVARVWNFLPAKARRVIIFGYLYTRACLLLHGYPYSIFLHIESRLGKNGKSKKIGSTGVKLNISTELGSDEPLARVFGVYPIFQSIVGELHYIDVIQLGLVSKSLRNVLFSNSTESEKSGHDQINKLYSCELESKKSCWACGLQICQGCSCRAQLREPHILFHTQLCRVQCSSCFYRKSLSSVVTAPRSHQQKTLECCCYDGRHQETLSIPSEWRLFCKICATSEIGKVNRQKSIESKYRKDCEGALSCDQCQKALPRGPRWWVCSKCNRECRGPHLRWVKTLTKEKANG